MLVFILLIGKIKGLVQSMNHDRLFETPMDYRTPDSSVLHYLLEFAQTHVH